MRRSALIAAAIGSLIASTSFAGFTINSTRTSLSATKDAIDIYGFNDGNGTGTDLLAATFLANSTGGLIHFQGSATTFRTSPSNLQTPSLGTAVTNFQLDFTGDAGSKGVIPGTSITPTSGPMGVNTNAGSGNNADLAGSQLGAAIAADRDIPNGIVFPANTGLGRQFLHLVVDKTVTSVSFTDLRLAGDVGPTSVIGTAANPYVIGATGGTAPVVTPAAQIVQFGSIVSNGAPFSVNVNVADVDGGLLTLAAGAASGGSVSNVTISPAGGANSPAVFTVSGTVAYGPNGTIVTIPVTATDNTGLTGSSTITLTLVPEPTTLAAFASVGLGLIRRRK